MIPAAIAVPTVRRMCQCLASCLVGIALMWCVAVVSENCSRQPVHHAWESSVAAGHGDGSERSGRPVRTDFAEAEVSVDEIELRHLPCRWPALGAAARTPCRLPPDRDRTRIAVEQTALIANAADLSRLCRLLL